MYEHSLGRPRAAVAEHRGHVGRPRSASADRSIAEATAQILTELGFKGLSMEGVASRAGVSKATLYRRYRSKEELVAATLVSITAPPQALLPRFEFPMRLDPAGESPPLPRGSGGSRSFDSLPVGTPGACTPVESPGTREMLTLALRAAAGGVSNPSWLPVLGAMLVSDDPAGVLAATVRAQVFEPAIRGVSAILAEGSARGEICPNASGAVVADLLFGALISRNMLGAPITDAWLETVVATVWQGIAAPCPHAADSAPSGDGRAATRAPRFEAGC